jgi:hypothetical protein
VSEFFDFLKTRISTVRKYAPGAGGLCAIPHAVSHWAGSEESALLDQSAVHFGRGPFGKLHVRFGKGAHTSGPRPGWVLRWFLEEVRGNWLACKAGRMLTRIPSRPVLHVGRMGRVGEEATLSDMLAGLLVVPEELPCRSLLRKRAHLAPVPHFVLPAPCTLDQGAGEPEHSDDGVGACFEHRGIAWPGTEVAAGRSLIAPDLSRRGKEIVDLALQVLDVVAAEGNRAAADEQRPAPFRLALTVAAKPAQEVFAKPDVCPRADYERRGERAFFACADGRVLELGSSEHVDAWDTAPFRARIEVTRRLFHLQGRMATDNTRAAFPVDLDIQLHGRPGAHDRALADQRRSAGWSQLRVNGVWLADR